MMRERWPRFRPEIELDPATLTRWVRRVLPDAGVIEHAAVGGGRANTNIRVTLDCPPGALLLRVYQRDPAQLAKEARLDGVLRAAGVPTAGFLRWNDIDEPTGLTYAVLDWVAGARLDLAIPGPEDARLGRAVGEVLARVHAIDVGPPGFLSPDTRPLSAITFGPEAMAVYVQACIIDGPGAGRLGPDLTSRLLDFIARAGDSLADWAGPPGLVHGDCNPSNFIISEGQVAALLDWEFAFSGVAAFDFGNLLRPPAGQSEAFSAGLAEGYRGEGGMLPNDWRVLSRIADLYAWADFLGREVVAREVVADSRIMVAETLQLLGG